MIHIELINYYHKDPLASYLGIQKTRELIAQNIISQQLGLLSLSFMSKDVTFVLSQNQKAQAL